MRSQRGRLADDRGSAPAEFALVSGLLIVLVLAVLQLALALHVRNTMLDAAAEGARYGALADRTPADALTRTRELITVAIGNHYADDIGVAHTRDAGRTLLTVTVRTTLPLIGLLGPERGLEVSGRAVIERLDEGR